MMASSLETGLSLSTFDLWQKLLYFNVHIYRAEFKIMISCDRFAMERPKYKTQYIYTID